MTVTSDRPRTHVFTARPGARLLDRLPVHAGTFAMIVGGLALAGWILDVDVLKGFGHRITMKPNTAVALMVCGFALRVLRRERSAWRIAAVAAASFASLLGTVTLSEHVFGWNLGIDQLLFSESPGAVGTASPGRMGPNASLSLTLAGVALIALRRGSRRSVVWAQILGLLIATLAMLAIVGYLYGAQGLYSVARYTGIAWPTAVTLVTIAVGILSVRPDVGPVSAFVSDGPGGLLARRMLLPVVLVPLVMGYMHLAAERRGLYDRGLGSALFAVSFVVIFAAAIWRTAIRLDATNLARQAVQDERDELLLRERAARTEAERASRLKDEFLATLSHELRTPLNVILGWTHMLGSERAGEERSPAAEIVARNGRMLARLVDDLLDVSRIATGRLHLEFKPIDFVPIAAAAVDGIQAEARAKGVSLVSAIEDARAVTLGDAERLQQVVVNLLSNALKFTPPGGRVEVGVRVRSSTVELTVRDSGQGIDPKFLPHVFDRFRQQDATATREHGGLGLGLSIVREFTELHGGSVMAYSGGDGTGSLFTVTLPLLEGSDNANKPSATATATEPSGTSTVASGA